MERGSVVDAQIEFEEYKNEFFIEKEKWRRDSIEFYSKLEKISDKEAFNLLYSNAITPSDYLQIIKVYGK
jgi:hypothetical protein